MAKKDDFDFGDMDTFPRTPDLKKIMKKKRKKCKNPLSEACKHGVGCDFLNVKV